MTKRENKIPYNTMENHSNNKEAYTDGSKSRGRKVSFAAVFADITRRGALPQKVPIHTAKMTAMRET